MLPNSCSAKSRAACSVSFEGEGRGLVDGDGAGMRGGIGVVAGVEGAGVESKLAVDIGGRHSDQYRSR